MSRLAMLALAASTVLSAAAQAQPSPVPTLRQGFGFCTVTDTSHAQARVWASPVLALEYAADDPGGTRRGLDLAGEFLDRVIALGGNGSKTCSALADTHAEAEAEREQQRLIWDKRMYFVKIGDWREVAWTPKPWQPAAPVAGVGPVTVYFLCQASDTDVQDRSDRMRTVAAAVFAMPVPGPDVLAAKYAQNAAYTAEFQTEVVQPRLPVRGSCAPYDTPGEAQYAYQQLLRLSKGFNMQYTEVAWTPDASVTALAQPQATPATPAADPSPPTIAAAPVAVVQETEAPAALYCVAFAQRAKPALLLRTPVWELDSGDRGHAGQATNLERVIAAVRLQHADGWRDLPPVACHDNAAVFAGETFCVATGRTRSTGVQMAGQFCNPSREAIGQRQQEMARNDGGNYTPLAWPPTP